MARCHVVCFGNELHGDDGFGIHVYRRLCDFTSVPHVRIFNAGICGLNALSFLESCRQTILVDALTASGDVGRVHIFRADDASFEGRFDGNSHEAGIPYLLKAARALFHPLPEILIIGVEVANIVPFNPTLSAPVEHALEPTVELILDRLRRV